MLRTQNEDVKTRRAAPRVLEGLGTALEQGLARLPTESVGSPSTSATAGAAVVAVATRD